MPKLFKIQGRTKSTLLENIPVIACNGEAPEAYVPGDVDFVLRAMNGYSNLRNALEIAQLYIKGNQLEHACINYPSKPEKSLGKFIADVLEKN